MMTRSCFISARTLFPASFLLKHGKSASKPIVTWLSNVCIAHESVASFSDHCWPDGEVVRRHRRVLGQRKLTDATIPYASPSTFFLDCCTTSSDCFASFALSMSSPLSSSDGACQNGQRAPFHSFSMYLYTRPHARSHAIPSPRAINHPIFSVTYAFCLLAFLPSFLIFQINAQSIPSTSLERHKNNTSSTISHAFP